MMKMIVLKMRLILLIFISIIYINVLPLDAVAKLSIEPYNDEVPGLNNQDQGPKYGQDSAKCVMELSLYREFYRQDNIKDAIRHWRWVFKNCPLATENTYIDGVKIVKYLISNQKDKTVKNKYIDTLMMVYDNRIKYFPNHYSTQENQVGYILGRKGVDFIKLRPEKYEEAYKIFKESVDLEGMNSQPAVLVYYFRSAITMVENGKAKKLLIVETYDQISDIIDYNITNNPNYAEEFARVKDNIELTFEP